MSSKHKFLIAGSFLLLGAIQGMLYHSLYSSHYYLASVQWPLLTAIYTSIIFNAIHKKVSIKKAIYFVLYFTLTATILYAICFLVGYSGFLLGILFSGFCSLLYFKGIQILFCSTYSFKTSKALLTGSLAYILNLLLLTPFISDLLLPVYYNKGSVENVITPFFIFWTFIVGSYGVFWLFNDNAPASTPNTTSL